MKDKALGFIETYGYLAAIEAADASLKAANVKLLGWEKIKGGLVTITMQGDVSAVKTAVDAGSAAANMVGTVISTNVIARPGEGLDTIVQSKEREDEVEEIEETEPLDYKGEIVEEESPNLDLKLIEFEGKTINIEDKDELENMKVVELRRLARNLETTIDNKDIKYSKKDELITAILSSAKRGE